MLMVAAEVALGKRSHGVLSGGGRLGLAATGLQGGAGLFQFAGRFQPGEDTKP